MRARRVRALRYGPSVTDAPARDRLFVAFDLADGLRRLLAEAGRRIAETAGGSGVPAENLHATVVFLGDLAEDRLPGVAGALSAAEGPAVRVAAGACRARPSASRARLVAVELADPSGALAERWRRLAEAVRRAAGMPRDDRAPWPHVTVARLRRPARVDVRGDWYSPEQMFDLPSATLYRSHLSRRGGPRYEALAAVRVGAAT